MRTHTLTHTTTVESRLLRIRLRGGRGLTSGRALAPHQPGRGAGGPIAHKECAKAGAEYRP
eukprot:5727223-Prymnesium_polylepis.1